MITLWIPPTFLPWGSGSLLDLNRQKLEFLGSEVGAICGAESCMEMMNMKGSLDFPL